MRRILRKKTWRRLNEILIHFKICCFFFFHSILFKSHGDIFFVYSYWTEKKGKRKNFIFFERSKNDKMIIWSKFIYEKKWNWIMMMIAACNARANQKKNFFIQNRAFIDVFFHSWTRYVTIVILQYYYYMQQSNKQNWLVRWNFDRRITNN